VRPWSADNRGRGVGRPTRRLSTGVCTSTTLNASAPLATSSQTIPTRTAIGSVVGSRGAT
jgi:hypothetical protein